jgi:hypothetical protein
VEEQNAVDAFSRRRELQVALAYALASGKMNASRSLNFSRQLSLDQESIALNRTVVGFNAGRDTFGWYFHPRIQSPPVESSNIGAFARMVWSTGPTDHYDYKHRRLEPGIRECEVLIAMPSFVNQVAFDVTSNWERIPRPGKTKRSYEEMVAQGGRLYRVQRELRELADEHCFRPGDSARLVSRVEQLEQMLGMQTHHVRVPYEYEQTGTDLFDTGNVHLKPIVHNFYGLRYVEANSNTDAHFFVAGKNFHPTLTHVIVGGTESHSIGEAADVEVISREVLKVTLKVVNAALSEDGKYELRIATPAGISNVVAIPSKPVPAQPAVSDFDWKTDPKYNGRLAFQNNKVEFVIEGVGGNDKLYVANNSSLPVAQRNNGNLLLRISAETADGKVVPLGEIQDYTATNGGNGVFEVTWGGNDGLAQRISTIVTHPVNGVQPSLQVSRIVGTAWIKFDTWPFVKFDKPLTISIQPVRLPAPTP